VPITIEMNAAKKPMVTMRNAPTTRKAATTTARPG